MEKFQRYNQYYDETIANNVVVRSSQETVESVTPHAEGMQVPVDKSDSVFILHLVFSVVSLHSRRTTFWSDTLVCFDCFPNSAF